MQRYTIFQLIQNNTSHPTVEMIWKGVKKTIPMISPDSVYRILKDFVSIGLLRQMDGLQYVRFDCNPSVHNHLVCTGCGTVMDFETPQSFSFPELPEHFGEVDNVELRLFGQCKPCTEKAKQKQPIEPMPIGI